MSYSIEINHLRKYYGVHRGIEDVTLYVETGDIHGFLGPNGAGKTTTIRILVGLLKQTSGSAVVLGKSPGDLKVKENIGYLPSDFNLYKHYTVKEYLDFIEQIRGRAPLRDELITRFQVDPSKKTRELSRGNKQKIGIIQALMHDPDLIIADEPTTGLDPLMQEEFIKVIREFHAKGKTIFLSSHILSEVQEICKTVSVIKDGKIISTGNVNDLLTQVPRKLIINFKTNVPKQTVQDTFNQYTINFDKTTATIYFTTDEFTVINKIKELPNVKSFLLPEPTLEEYFLPIYSNQEGAK